MKKSLLHFAYVGAIALVGSVCFSACSDDVSKELEINPVNGGQKVDFTDVVGVSDVPVDFVFNVSTKTGADTRMSAAVVQADGQAFRGINHGRIAAFKTAANGQWITDPANSESNGAGVLKIFPEFTSLITASSGSTRVLELAMPSGTNGVLFYGSAPNGGNPDLYGKIGHNNNGGNIKNMILSYQERIKDETTYNQFQQVGQVIAAIMTGLVDMGFKSSSPVKQDRDFYFWWPEGNADETKNNVWTSAETQLFSYDDDIYMEIYDSPKRNVEADVTAYKTAHSLEALPNPKYMAKHITTGKYDNGTAGDAEISADGKVNGMIVSKTVGTGAAAVTYRLYHTDVTWKAYKFWYDKTDTSTYPEFGGAYEANLSPLGQKLGAAYKALTTMQVGELRSAAADDILALAKDLYDVVSKVRDAIPTNKYEYVAKKFAGRLAVRLQQYFDFTNSSPEWKDITEWGPNLVSFVDQLSDHNNQISISGLTTTHIKTFPTGELFCIPPGASLLSFSYQYGPVLTPTNTNDKSNYKNIGGLFKFLEYIPNYDLGGAADGSSNITVHNYVYPAELMYFGNSPIRVTETDLLPTNYPQSSGSGAGGWLNDDSWTSNGWIDNGSVDSNVHGVAMKANINYGVAMLETKVRIGAEILYDNNAAINTSETNKSITATDNLFELTGIIIGEQPQSVGWDYTPATVPSTTADGAKDMAAVSGATAKKLTYWDRLVYDKVYNSQNTEGVAVTKADDPAAASYTLLLDNYMNDAVQTKYKDFVNYDTGDTPAMSDKQQQIVYIALEFKNKAGNFMGKHNMVRNGSKFYLIGALDPKDKNVTERNDDHPIPPYASGTTMTWTPRVFMQDYMTTVTFTINANSLQHAYLTVPNLKASQVSLGLSVDVTWERGINFGNVVL